MGFTIVYFINVFVIKARHFYYCIYGGIIAVLPDIEKLIDSIFLHSMLVIPFASILLNIFISQLYKHNKYNFLTTYMISIMCLLSHILFDFLENGVALLYPLTKKEYEYAIFNQVDYILLVIFTLIIIFSFFSTVSSTVFKILSTCLLCYVIVLCISKQYLHMQLYQKYNSQHITLLETYPSSSETFCWNYQIRTLKTWYDGHSLLFGKLQEDSQFNNK
ncbi:metal-dependent hydrolase [Paenibacillus shirakamiensis]